MKIKLIFIYGFPAIILALILTACRMMEVPHSIDITYTVTQTGGRDGVIDSAGIVFTFSASVDDLNLTAADITVSGVAEKGSGVLTGSETRRTLTPITVNAVGTATVEITKTGIETGTKNVTVYKEGQMTHGGTVGLSFALLNNNATAYRVRKGSVTSGAVVIPATYNGLPVMEIGSAPDSYSNGAFSDTSITGITIPAGITVIGNHAFRDCISLISVTFAADSRLKSIGHGVFSGCTSLTSIAIPAGVTSIGDAVFFGCQSLTSINIPAGVTTISRHMFSACRSLTSIEIPAGVTSIGDAVFFGCRGLTSITIPESVTSIGSSAFSSCRNLISIEIPAGVTTIGDSAFFGCSGLTSIEIPAGITSISDSTFSSCNNLTSVTFAAGSQLQNIGNNAFSNCISLTGITIPEGVTSIGSRAFSNTSFLNASLVNITIPNTVTSIGSDAFYGWTSEQTIYVPFAEGSLPSGWDLSWNDHCDAAIKYWNGSEWVE